MNCYNAVGNVASDTELRYLPNQTAVLQFSFAVNSGYGDNKQTTFFRCQLFGKRAETLAPMLNKGDKVGISGELTNRKYVDKQGAEKYSLELRINDLTLLSSKGDTKPQVSDNNAARAQESGARDPFDDLESNIPF